MKFKLCDCEGQGWVESYHGAGDSWTPSIQQCPKRCNIGGYSTEVQRRLSNPRHVTQRPVLQTEMFELPCLKRVNHLTVIK